MRRARGSARRRTAGLLLAALTVAGIVVAQPPAGAAPTPGPTGIAFYTPPAGPPSGTHGDLVSYRSTTVNLGPGAPAVNAWNVMYQSTDAAGAPVYVTGTVLVPTAPATGTRPVVSYAFGTHGLAQRCAPSLQLGAGTDYENPNLVAALQKGYAVVATDYAGYTTGSTPTYVIGATEGHAVLDIVKAASQVPGAGVSASAPTAVWGYSQGGQAAAWAGELQPTYAPGLALKGVAAGGIPADLAETARYLDGGAGAAFEVMAVIGLATQYPSLPIDAILTPDGKAAFDAVKSQCVFEALPALRNKKLSDFTTGGLGLDALLSLQPVADVVNAQKVGTKKIAVPLYGYHGQADELVPLGQGYAAKQRYCALGTKTTFDLYRSEHITTQFQAAPKALAFIADRFAGTPATDNCAQSTPPASTAPPKGGDFAVALDGWGLGGKVHLATLDQDVTLPSGSTFSADANLTTQALIGDLDVPDFDSPINLFGILPLTARIGLEPAGTTGTVALDTSGQLKVHGTAKATIVVRQLSLLGIPVTAAACRTSTPVEFALSFDGPVNALGSTGLTFGGTFTMPTITGCEGDFIGAFVGLFMTAPNNTFTFTVTPPAPVRA
jgi:pimeloyl-ACP methyl ester carboxylesterase